MASGETAADGLPRRVPARRNTVVLVHGLWMHGVVFFALKRRLEHTGFDVHTWSYPSVRGSLKANAQALSDALDAISTDTIHLVGHSLGGIVAVTALAQRHDPRIGRVVLMGSPFSGSRSADTIAGWPVLSALIGRSMRDWMAITPRPAVDGLDVGVLAGTRAIGLVGTLVTLPKPNDGVVTVAETRCDVARDAVTLPVNHTEMLFSRRCAKQVVAFLRTGRFEHDSQ